MIIMQHEKKDFFKNIKDYLYKIRFFFITGGQMRLTPPLKTQHGCVFNLFNSQDVNLHCSSKSVT